MQTTKYQITELDVEEAIRERNSSPEPLERRSKKFCLTGKDGKHYPPKHLLRLIHKKREMPVEELSKLKGGEATNNKFRRLGYKVDPCSCPR